MKIVLLLGPAGAGKISAARRMTSEIPDLDHETSLEAAWIHWGARLVEYGVPVVKAPFRAPHYTVSEAGLVGSPGKRVFPGEASLAHGGCLVLDELPEFRRSSLEALSRVLKSGESLLSGAALPSKPALVCATANLCGCGWLGGPRPCICEPESVDRWMARLLNYCDTLGVQEVIPVQYPRLLKDVTSV